MSHNYVSKCLSVASAVFVGSVASLLFVMMAHPAQAQTPPEKGSWNFASDGTSVTFNPTTFFNGVGDNSNYGGKTQAQMGAFNGTLATPLSSVGAFPSIANIYTFMGLNGADPAGKYYIVINSFSNNFFSYDTYYELDWDPTTLTGTPNNVGASNQELVLSSNLKALQNAGTHNTRFLNTTVSGPRTAVAFNVSYFLQTSEFTNENIPDAIQVDVLQRASLLSVTSEKASIVNTTNGTSTKIVTLTSAIPNTAQYTAKINFYNVLNDTKTFTKTSITVNFDIVGGNVANVVVVSVKNALKEDITEMEVCSLTNLSGCLNNSVRFLFIPSTAVVDQFFESLATLNTKVPFVYLSQSVTLINTIFSQPSQSLPAISIPFLSGSVPIISPAIVTQYPFVSLLRTLIAAGMWITLLYGLYNMALGIHDKNLT